MFRTVKNRASYLPDQKLVSRKPMADEYYESDDSDDLWLERDCYFTEPVDMQVEDVG